MAKFEPCGGCGATVPAQRCIGCFHNFGGGSTTPTYGTAAEGKLVTNKTLAEALADLTDAFLSRNGGAFPLDRVTDNQRHWHRAMTRAYELIGQPNTPAREAKMSALQGPISGGVTVSIKPMRLSDGRCDYFVSFKCAGHEVTPHVFREQFKAEYHVALYQWLFGQAGKPDLMAFDEDEWPAREFTPEEQEAFAALRARPVVPLPFSDITVINGAPIAEFVQGYRYETEDFEHKPTTPEAMMIEDAICTFISDTSRLSAAIGLALPKDEDATILWSSPPCAHFSKETTDKANVELVENVEEFREWGPLVETPGIKRSLCSDCPPIGYLPDETRCTPCPRRSALSATSQAKGGSGVAAIAAERQRQIEAEGWTPSHDDEHEKGELAAAAANYALYHTQYGRDLPNHIWPWAPSWWKPTNPRRDLIKAGALIAAEIDRLDRQALRSSSPVGQEQEAGDGATLPADTVRVCPARDMRCPHGMSCPYVIGWSCSDPALYPSGQKGE